MRVPELTRDTVLRLDFNDPDAIAPAFTTNGTVWSDGYRAVWHMRDGTGDTNIMDSTANRFDGVKKAAGSPAEADAVVGKGQQFDSSSINLTGLTDTSTTHTVSMWLKSNSSAKGLYPFDVESGRFLFGWGSDTAGKIGLYRSGWLLFGNTPSANVWHHIALCCGGGTATLYVDGLQYGTGAYSGVGFSGKVALGSRWSMDSYYFPGVLDEVRLSSVLRSPDWIAASYANMLPNSTFCEYSPVMPTPTPSLQIVSRPTGYGVAAPAYGLQEGLVSGHTYTCSVSRLWNNDTEGFRYICSGWKRYGIDRSTFDETLLGEAATNELIYTHTDLERLEWHFTLEGVRIAAPANAGGFVAVPPEHADGFYTIGSTATLTATPSNGYAFVCWQGDLPPSVVDPKAATISFVADQPRQLTPLFKPAVTFHVATTGLDTNDGSELSPFATLTNAVAQATAVYDDANTYTIIIEDGAYTHGNIKINVPLTIRSRNGLDSVTLLNSIAIGAGTGNTADNVAFYLNADGIVLDGLLLRAVSTSTGRAITAVKQATIRNCAVRDWQTANYSVNGIVLLSADSILDNCEIINCLVRSSGGQARYGIVYVSGNAAICDTVITNCSLVRQPSSSGSAIYAAGNQVNSLLVRNSLIAKCTSDRRDTTDMEHGGAIYLSGANMHAVLENVTLAHCKDIGLGVAGLNVRSIASLAARNMLFYGNQNSSTVKDVGFASGMGVRSQFDNCAFTAPIPAEIAGNGNVTVHEPFAGEGDYRLAMSAAVDGGAALDWMTADATDIFGQPRVNGTSVDIGAAESSPSGPLACNFSCDTTRGIVPLTVNFQAVAGGGNLDGLTYIWSFRNGETVDLAGPGPANASPSYTYTDAGYFTVSLTVTNNAGEQATTTVTNLIYTLPRTMYVSPDGTAEMPYDTWAKAARSPLDAVAIAEDNCTIWVTNGTYALNNDIILDAAIALRSVEGPEVTILDRGLGSRVIYMNHADTVLAGFTCQRAKLYNIQSSSSSALVTNCISRQCAGSWDSRGAGARMEGGTITHCQIYNNSNYSTGGQATWGTGLHLEGGAFANCCVISNNTMGANNSALSSGAGVYLASANTLLRNSLVCGNRSVRGSAGVHAVSGASIENCTIIDNTCSTAHPGAVGLMGPGSGSGVNVINTIIWGNLFVAEELNYGGRLNAGAVCTTPLITAGEGHTDTPPAFKDRAAGDYRLKPDSSCVESGIYAPWMDGATDLAGVPRIVRRKVDIGCYEYALLPGTFIILR